MLKEVVFGEDTVQVSYQPVALWREWDFLTQFDTLDGVISDGVTTALHNYLIPGPVGRLRDFCDVWEESAWLPRPADDPLMSWHSTEPLPLRLRSLGINPHLEAVRHIGNMISGNGRSFNDIYTTNPAGENSVKHDPNYFGECFTATGHQSLWTEGSGWIDEPFHLSANSEGQLFVDPLYGGGPGGGWIDNILSREGYIFHTATGDHTVSNIELEYLDRQYIIRYNLETVYSVWNSPIAYRRTYHIVIIFSMTGLFLYDQWASPNHRIYDWSSANNDFRHIIDLEYHRTCLTSQRKSKFPEMTPGIPGSWHNVNKPSSGTYSETTDGACFCSFTAVGSGILPVGIHPEDGLIAGFSAYRRRSLLTGRFVSVDRQFGHIDTDEWFNHLSPAMPLAISDALRTLTVWNSNNIENALQISQLLDILDTAATLNRLRILLTRGDPIGALAEFSSILGDSYLMYRFGLAPTYDDAKFLVHEHKKVIKSFRQFTRRNKPIVLHGSHFSAHPSTHIFPYPFKLTAKCKMEVMVGPSFVAGMLIALDKNGALPNMSRFWDNVPMSVFVDWLWPVGRNLRTADALLTGMLYDTRYYCLSLRADTMITQDQLPEGTIAKNAVARFYRRLVSNAIPSFGMPSVYDFIQPTGVDEKIIGALVLSQLGAGIKLSRAKVQLPNRIKNWG